MRVLVSTPAGIGHILPMVPLARALASRGHELRWALPEPAAAHVTDRSLAAIPLAGFEPINPQDVVRRYPQLGGPVAARAAGGTLRKAVRRDGDTADLARARTGGA
jgi:hypothetical protein